MTRCLQTKNQSVFEHGESVWNHTKKLISGSFDHFKLPLWFTENHAFIVNNLHHIADIRLYNIYHDCGKPYCITHDSSGTTHFPNHAHVSKDIWNSMSDNRLVGELIGHDMCLHTETAECIKQLNWDKRTAFTLLITAFAEIHSNAMMFGGIESVSFKMKWKQVERRGKMLFNLFKEEEIHPYSYVIVRKDLSESQRAVQGTHAAVEFYKHTSINYHPSVIYVVVKSEKKLKAVSEELCEQGIRFTMFREPMFENQLTAIYTEPLEGERRAYLQRFMLM